MQPRTSALLLVGCLLLSACGGSNPKPPSKSAEVAPPAALRAAERVSATDFPAPPGRSLQALASTVRPGPQVGLASSVLLPGKNRLAFGVIGPDRKFLYGKTAVYLARTPKDRALGPYPAPADSMLPAKRFLSKTAAADVEDVKAIYQTDLLLRRPGRYALLVVTRSGAGLLGAATRVSVRRASPIPNLGERPPRIHTDTVASAGGNLDKIDTRVPHDDMHNADFKDVLGKRPVALLFSTPQLCQSRVCGPVTDLAVQLEHTYGKRMTFIHEEVYVRNQVNKGLRPQLRAFHLQTEPWLFTFDRHGRVAARLEGAFGIDAFRAALQAALR